jgi:hypothetical protein
MTEKRIGLFKGRGAYTERMACVQVSIPMPIAELVQKKADQECFSQATYYRKWILEGFRKAQSKGEI